MILPTLNLPDVKTPVISKSARASLAPASEEPARGGSAPTSSSMATAGEESSDFTALMSKAERDFVPRPGPIQATASLPPQTTPKSEKRRTETKLAREKTDATGGNAKSNLSDPTTAAAYAGAEAVRNHPDISPIGAGGSFLRSTPPRDDRTVSVTPLASRSMTASFLSANPKEAGGFVASKVSAKAAEKMGPEGVAPDAAVGRAKTNSAQAGSVASRGDGSGGTKKSSPALSATVMQDATDDLSDGAPYAATSFRSVDLTGAPSTETSHSLAHLAPAVKSALESNETVETKEANGLGIKSAASQTAGDDQSDASGLTAPPASAFSNQAFISSPLPIVNHSQPIDSVNATENSVTNEAKAKAQDTAISPATIPGLLLSSAFLPLMTLRALAASGQGGVISQGTTGAKAGSVSETPQTPLKANGGAKASHSAKKTNLASARFDSPMPISKPGAEPVAAGQKLVGKVPNVLETDSQKAISEGHGAEAKADASSGMAVAPGEERMKSGEDQNKIAGQATQKLPPASALTSVAAVKGASAGGAEVRLPVNFSSGDNVAQPILVAATPASTAVASPLPASTVSAAGAMSAATVDRLEQLITREAVSFKSSGGHDLGVTLRVDGNTQLFLQLSYRDGQTQAFLTCEKGDLPAFNAHYGQLQESLARQNIQLQPSGFGAGADFHRGSDRQERQSEPQESAVARPLAASKTASVTVKPKTRAYSRQGFESWA